MSVEIPPTAAKLRRALNLAQSIQSHALSFFYLARPTCFWAWTPTPPTAISSAWPRRILSSGAPAWACAALVST